MIVTLALLFTPGDPNSYYTFFKHEDKVAHVTLFCTLCFLWMWVLDIVDIKRKYVLVAVGGIILAFLSEYIQQFIPYRAADKFDVVADLIGVAASLIIYKCVQKTNDSFHKKIKDVISLNFVRF